ncbi:MAG: RnfABCDGE type electron transport complex subunit B [Oscillospiraceae bacterium]|nr:RnfABCDGE type electron transport complex subunit B [Oscillospiraceae bacterium]MDE6900984.1 RnfABCDGE type electron transport complex subunit B [Oscillospiraceae bacterium]
MNIFYAVLTLGVLGGAFGLILSLASKVFEVKTDPKLDLILDCLPGANCGGCGYPGCAGCAAAILAKEAPVNACPSCSGLQTSRIAAVMGVEVKAQERRVAFVRCSGGDRASRKFERYVGIEDCVAAMKVSGNGTLECSFGCLGRGTCIRACKFDAIRINAHGVAEVDQDKCTHCMQCAKACPRHVITDVPYAVDIVVPCANLEKGAQAKANCSVSCIGCRLCEKNCPTGAITVQDNVACIDYSKCTSCGACAAKCPRKLITDIHATGKVEPVAPVA